ncbi:hypothetical protein BDC45DRAFT_321486 [Circinella umbellata]|nr:hypothetical protein BDC45DRAFT_321486 [Circinella umbellata]
MCCKIVFIQKVTNNMKELLFVFSVFNKRTLHDRVQVRTSLLSIYNELFSKDRTKHSENCMYVYIHRSYFNQPTRNILNNSYITFFFHLLHKCN